MVFFYQKVKEQNKFPVPIILGPLRGVVGLSGLRVDGGCGLLLGGCGCRLRGLSCLSRLRLGCVLLRCGRLVLVRGECGLQSHNLKTVENTRTSLLIMEMSTLFFSSKQDKILL